jgi:hypothetical protein
LRLRIHNPLDDTDQVNGAVGQAVNTRHHHHVAEDKPVERTEKFAPVGA